MMLRSVLRSSSHAVMRLAYPARRAAVPLRQRRLVTAPAALPRVFLSLLPSGPALLPPDEAKHVAKALRMVVGDKLELFDGAGRVVQCQVSIVSQRGGVTVAPLHAPVSFAWEGPAWDVYVGGLAGLPASRSDWLVEKVCELGARSLTPLLCDHGSSSSGGAGEAESRARWGRLAVAASKQSLRLHGLALRPAEPLSRVLLAPEPTDVSPLRPLLVVAAVQGAPSLRTALRLGTDASSDAIDLTRGGRLIIGPPGGWSDAEVALMSCGGEAGGKRSSSGGARVVAVGLGPLRLRTETAALSLLAAVQILAE